MKEVIKTLAPEPYEVLRGGETTKVKIVPQMVSSLRKELTFPEDFKGKSEKKLMKYQKKFFSACETI